MNTGDEGGSQALLRIEREKSLAKNVPLITIWCAVYRSNLAFDNLEKQVPEVLGVISGCVGIATFIRVPGLPTGELEECGRENGFRVRHFPRYFEVRLHSLPSPWVSAS